MPAPALRSIGRIILAALFLFLGLSAWNEAIEILRGESDAPRTLMFLQTLIGAIAVATAWGAWKGARWSVATVVLYGVATAGMIVGLGPMLDMPVEERGGLLIGAGGALLVSLVCAWFLHWSTQRVVSAPVAERP